MHDINDLDGRGIAGGFVASDEFRDAAKAQGDALGFHARAIYVPHPIQDRTDEEMKALARKAFPAVLDMLRQGQEQDAQA
ncbi:MAG: hypothetical protein EA417_13070 [Gammaproteobacteria bacterium]|nr:MAG: hypothetical protein EA417_13070 [Gammaproteobacteria bacterium]